MRPKTQFADAGGVQIAYQTFGEGPDVVVVPGWVSNVEQSWESPEKAAFYADLAQTCRVTLFDKRGTGLSDRNVGAPTLEDRMDDLQAVMDAARIKRSIVFGISEGGSLAMVFAASNPERVRALALYGTFACREKKPDYPWAPSPEERQAFYDSISNAWSGEMDLAHSAPSLVGNQEHLERWARYLRSSATPSDALALAKLNTQIDVRHVLPLIRVPTVIMRRVGDRDVRREEAIYLQLHIPNAELRELPGEDHLPMVGDTAPILEIIREIAGAETPLSPIAAFSPPCFSATSWVRRIWFGNPEMRPGSSLWPPTTTWFASWSCSTAGRSSSSPETESWPTSTGLRGPRNARFP
jgi:pimeloyl-ACP methyl ester carboxylesterase